MKQFYSYSTLDGKTFNDYDKAAYHAEKRYGDHFSMLAKKLSFSNYKNIIEWLKTDDAIDELMYLKILKDDRILVDETN